MTEKHGFEPTFGDSPRDKLLEAASVLFCRDGISATGVDKVVELAGTAKTTLYKCFGSKEGLVEAVLEAEGHAWRTWFLSEVHRARGGPRKKLQRIFKVLETWFSAHRFYGCPFINAVGESSKADDRMRELAIAHKTVILAEIESLSREAGASDPKRLTHQAAMLIDGAIVTAMITKDAKVARIAGQAFGTILDDALGNEAKEAA
ncbi:TetR/AcrR family transcriptional regulator [Amorphus orientalis]|uniref:AcrR family transcriptional regulator n=1 Tax=Amorphus orientalis TaxID=649198 RepID=A0AAE4AT41_9HYPH|nr:TetR/AcrR family transcriptional regulator [Amorphus orientalis]MDQ0315762.1 AcrR family transcriptional regulator [Amorphus orientalis]